MKKVPQKGTFFPYPDSYRDPQGELKDFPMLKSPPCGAGGLILIRQLSELGKCKYRAILANIYFADIAPAAFPEAAFHSVFESCKDVFI
jgi:hypothetical protein